MVVSERWVKMLISKMGEEYKEKDRPGVEGILQKGPFPRWSHSHGTMYLSTLL